jgi:hypothetical protein
MQCDPYPDLVSDSGREQLGIPKRRVDEESVTF